MPSKQPLQFTPVAAEDTSRYAKVKEFCKMPVKKEDFSYSANTQTFFMSKGINKKSLQKCFIYERTMLFPGLETMEVEVFCCPIFKRGGTLVNIKIYLMLSLSETAFCTADGAEMGFLGMETLSSLYQDKGKEKYVIICMDDMDRLSFVEAGFEKVISVPQTTNYNWLDESTLQLFERIEIAYIASHNNHEGTTVRDELSRRIGKNKCKSIAIPESCVTANDVLDPEGVFRTLSESERVEKLKHLYASAKPLQISGIYTASDFTIELNNLHKEGYPKGFKTGIAHIDRIMTLYPGLFTLITATPSSGKSTLVKCLFPKYQKWGEENNMPIKMALYSAEDKNPQMAMMKIIQNKSGKHVIPHENQISQMELSQTKAWLNDNFLLIRPEGLDEWLKEKNITNSNSLSGLLTYAEICVKMYGVNWFVIDNWSTIEKDYMKGESMDSFTARSLYKIVEWAAKHSCHVTLIAHPTKTEKDNHNNFKMLSLYNVSGSSHFFNAPDIGITLQRDEYRPSTPEDEEQYFKKYHKNLDKKQWIRDYTLPTQVHTIKVRDEWMGQYGYFDAYMDRYRGNSYVFSKEELHFKNKTINYNDRVNVEEQPELPLETEKSADEELTDELPF